MTSTKFSEGDRDLSIHPENGQVSLFYKKENLILVLENSRLDRWEKPGSRLLTKSV